MSEERCVFVGGHFDGQCWTVDTDQEYVTKSYQTMMEMAGPFDTPVGGEYKTVTYKRMTLTAGGRKNKCYHVYVTGGLQDWEVLEHLLRRYVIMQKP